MRDSIKAGPRKIIAVQKYIMSLKNNAQQRMCIYLIFHLALEKVKSLFKLRSAVCFQSFQSWVRLHCCRPRLSKMVFESNLLMKIGSCSSALSLSTRVPRGEVQVDVQDV